MQDTFTCALTECNKNWIYLW